MLLRCEKKFAVLEDKYAEKSAEAKRRETTIEQLEAQIIALQKQAASRDELITRKKEEQQKKEQPESRMATLEQLLAQK